jgi:hypothetical protein
LIQRKENNFLSNNYIRCLYIGLDSIQCETWFLVDANTKPIPKYCTEHNNGADASQNKNNFINQYNEVINQCSNMTLIELDHHIASIEAKISVLKTELTATRGIRASKIEKLTDAERVERRKYVVPKNDTLEKTRVVSMKKDPVKHLTGKLNITADLAKDLLSMDCEALLAKYKTGGEK